jgi:hypothetical protein
VPISGSPEAPEARRTNTPGERYRNPHGGGFIGPREARAAAEQLTKKRP